MQYQHKQEQEQGRHYACTLCRIGDQGAEQLAEGLKKCTLKKLSLRGNGIKDDGASAIAAALKENQSLEHLAIDRNSIGEEAKQKARDSCTFPALNPFPC